MNIPVHNYGDLISLFTSHFKIEPKIRFSIRNFIVIIL
jgi:hypothetical protein